MKINLIPNKKNIQEDKNKTQPNKKTIINLPNKTVLTDKKIVPINKNIITAKPKTISTKDFQLKIFQEINRSNFGKNIMISPMSIYHILSLTANGAANKTLTEMFQALSENKLIDLNQKNNIISKLFTNFKSIELANAVFTRFKPLDELNKMIIEYKAKLDILKDANQINKWCSDATHQKITKIIDDITNDDKMVLINAIYFKGIWHQPFDKNCTELGNFFGPNNQI